MKDWNLFMAMAQAALKHPQSRARAEALLVRWSTLWPSPNRSITCTISNHGAFLHFNQLIGTTWSQVFTFHVAPKHGLSLRGPDPDRFRKSHKYRDNPLDRSGLDALFAAWSAHPEARPAGNAIELYLEEASDDVWEACLQELLASL